MAASRRSAVALTQSLVLLVESQEAANRLSLGLGISEGCFLIYTLYKVVVVKGWVPEQQPEQMSEILKFQVQTSSWIFK